MKYPRTSGLPSSVMLENAQAPSGFLSASTTTIPVGHSRKTATYARNGTVPLQAGTRRRRPGRAGFAARAPARLVAVTATVPPLAHRAGPVRREVGGGGGVLALAEEHRRPGDRRQLRRRRGVDGAVGRHGLLLHRPGAAFQPEVLPAVGRLRVQELLPQPGRGRVRCVLVDGLRI